MNRTAAVIYLRAPDEATAAATFDELSTRCEQYAFRFCWELVETVHDVGGSNEYFDYRTRANLFGRAGLGWLLALLEEKQALIVLVPDPQMIGSTAAVYNAVRERVEKHGCFLQVVRGTPPDAQPSSALKFPSATSGDTNSAVCPDQTNEAKRPMTETPKARILALAIRADFSDSFGALLHMTALMASDSKTLVPKTEEERIGWGGHLDGLHAALLCLARHEQQLAPEVAAETVNSLLDQARAILQEHTPGSEGPKS